MVTVKLTNWHAGETDPNEYLKFALVASRKILVQKGMTWPTGPTGDSMNTAVRSSHSAAALIWKRLFLMTPHDLSRISF